MPFDHKDHYHRLLLRQVPRNCGAALDVGCGPAGSLVGSLTWA
ncbi:hypothetical protein ACFZCV_35360 [Streptomyces sp. NPDC007920]